MIISISGKKGAGKDLVGNIIRYLLIKEKERGEYWQEHPPTFSQWQTHHQNNTGEWKIVKFADKLKDMVCLLIGCTREELEDQEFKDTELGEEWRKYYITHPQGKMSKWYGSMEEARSAIEEPPVFSGILSPSFSIESQVLTPRLILQLLGTDCVRNIIHPSAWVNATMAKYGYSTYTVCDKCSYATSNPHYYDKPCLNCGELLTEGLEKEWDNWIITDCRFPNELKAVKDRGGITIRVNRGFDVLNGKCTIDVHPSETALDNAEFDYVIDNNGSIDELIEKVVVILKKLNYIK